MICDFCSSIQPRFCYKTDSPIVSNPIQVPSQDREHKSFISNAYDERWAACALCAEIIDRRDIDGLTKRAVESFAISEGVASAKAIDLLVESTYQTYKQFFTKLSGVRKMTLEEIERQVEDGMPRHDWGPTGFNGLFICDTCEVRFSRDNSYGGEVGKATYCDRCWKTREAESQHRLYTHLEKVSDPEAALCLGHGGLTQEQVVRVKKYKKILAEVETMSYSLTKRNLEHDQHPEKEIRIWEAIARKYEEFLIQNPHADTAERKRQYLGWLGASAVMYPIRYKGMN